MLYFITDLLVLGCINSIMVVGLNLQYGYAGLLNFAFYTYVALGAYVAAVTTMGPSTIPGISYILGWHLPWWMGLLLGGLAASAVGSCVFLLTVRRLRSDYLAIVTVSVAFIFWNVIDADQGLFAGDAGLFNVPQILGGASMSTETYTLVMLAVSAVCLAGAVWLSRRIFRSPFGRLLRAIREDDQVSSAFGRAAWKPQIKVFAVGCFLAGVAGGLLVYYISAWNPAAWLPVESFILLAALIVGGSGNYWGALFGAFVLIEGLAEIARYVPSFGNGADVGPLRLIVIGLVLIIFLRRRPEGLIPERWLRWYKQRDSSAQTEAAELEPAHANFTEAQESAAVAAAESAPAPLVQVSGRAHDASGDVLVEVRDVGFSYGGARAVNGCSFTIARGAVTGLIGPNGAGKSTMVELLSGRLTPHAGEILMDGANVGGRGPVGMAQLGVARTFQSARVLPRLPVIENVMIGAPPARGEAAIPAVFSPRVWRDEEAARRAEARELLAWLGLSTHLERPAGSLSGGQRRLMEIARALMAHPRLLLMDEPTAGVYPETSQLIARRVREIVDAGVTVLLIAHNMAFLEAVADDVVVMAEGKVLTRGALEQVRDHEDVIAAYLGVAAGSHA